MVLNGIVCFFSLLKCVEPALCVYFHHSSYCLLCLGRRVLIFPKGNNVDHLSMYLDVADSSSLPYAWSRYAQFSLAVVNQIHHKYSVRKGTPLFILFLGIFFFFLFSLRGKKGGGGGGEEA